MRAFRQFRSLSLLLSFLLVVSPLKAIAEDIDIFVLPSGSGTTGNPNVLIVLDNTSNWSAQNQHWPGGLAQGQSEVRAIKNVIANLNDKINVGLMEFTTGSGSGYDAGYVRQYINKMDAATKAEFSAKLDTIFGNINSTVEKQNSSLPYGNLMYDAYKYFTGGVPLAAPGKVPGTLADNRGYTSPYTNFKSPVSAEDSCGKNFIIFIGNGFPNADEPALLAGVGGDTTKIKLPDLVATANTKTTLLGATTSCYSSSATCQTVDYTAQCDANYNQGCKCGTDPLPNSGKITCPVGTLAYSVLGTTAAIPPGTNTYTISNTAMGAVSGSNADWSITTQNAPNLPAGASISINGCDTGSGGKTLNGTYTLAAASVGNTFHITANKGAPSTCSGPGIVTFTTSGVPAKTDNLGLTTQCYANLAACSTSDYAGQCASYTGGCACGVPTDTVTAGCNAGTAKYNVYGTNTVTAYGPTGTFSYASPTSKERYSDEWARFLYQTDISAAPGKQNVITYTIDVYKDQQSPDQTSLLMSMATAGHGKYFAATSEEDIKKALEQIMAEIQGVNSTFASASLPVNATNRAQNENQVFIGMFRPDSEARPRWMGNMKRYQLIRGKDGVIELGDSQKNNAVNNTTGFLSECAISFWTTDSGTYWQDVTDKPSTWSKCTDATMYSDSPDGPTVEKGGVAEVIRKGNAPDGTNTTPTWTVNRKIYTLSSGSLADFTTGSTGLDSGLVDFTRGHDINNENGNANFTETRPSLHGDVIHSRPLPINYGTESIGVVAYYGANDGTFRAVQASNGKELWAFIAPETISRLQRLKDNAPLINYPTVPASIVPTPQPKDYFFDGSSGVYQDKDNTKIWLFPTMRRGGRMVYAFDVTNPTSPSFKWRVGCPNRTNDTDCTSGMTGIGQTWSTPVVANIKGYSTTNPVLIFGGGYDSCEDQDTASPACTNEKGRAVYVLDAATGALLKTFTTLRSIVGDVMMVDIDNDTFADYAYVADTGGNIYRINFIDNPTSKNALAADSWGITRAAYTNGAGRKFLFAPEAVPNGTGTSTRVFIAIGSGDREHPLQQHYPFNSVVNRFYVYKDNPAENTAFNLDSIADMYDYTSNTGCDDQKINLSTGKKGWFMDLNQYGQGEQTVGSALITAGLVTFSTNRPIPPSPGTCTTLGEARGYWLNLFNASGAIGVSGSCGGARSAPFVGGGLPPSPVLGVVPIDGKRETVVLGAVRKDGGASTPISPQKVAPTITSKRKGIYWKTWGDN